MNAKILVGLVIFAVLIVSGCTQSPTDIAKATNSAKSFLAEYPNAEIVAMHLDKNYINDTIGDLRRMCGDQMRFTAYWKVIIKDVDSIVNVTVWVEENEMKAVCVVKDGDIQDKEIDRCIDASVLIQGATYFDENNKLVLYVANTGDSDVTLSAILEYQNGNIVEDSVEYKITAGGLKNFTIENVYDTLENVTINSKECQGVKDFIDSRWIIGMN